MTPEKTVAPGTRQHGTDAADIFALADSPEFQAALGNEFPEGASEWSDPVSRRRFMALMGASAALAGAAGCIRPAAQRKIVPYTSQPEEMTPGVPLYFSTAAPLGGYGTGILVRSHEGRPVKVEGNPLHPSSLGGAGIFAQASLLDLYDPDRSRATTDRGVPTAYDLAVRAVKKELFDGERDPFLPTDGVALKSHAFTAKRVRILTETVTSPTLADQIGRLLGAFDDAKWVIHDPIGRDNCREGIQKAFGKSLNIVYDFKKADVIVSLGADFICEGPGSTVYSREYASRRRVRKAKEDGIAPTEMSRLYAIETMPTNTGAVADHRLALTSGQIESFARELAKELGVQGTPAAGALPERAKKWVSKVAEDLKKAERKGKTLIVVGDHLPASLHALAFAINNTLGNIGQTVLPSAPVEARPDGKVIDLKTLTTEMAAGKVDVLLIFSSNPAYTAPADVPFVDALAKVNFTLHLGTHQDETGVLCKWHINEAHYLETWGDIRGHDGTATIQQPLIAPLFNGKSAIEFIADVTNGPAREGLDIVKAFWKKRFADSKGAGEFEIFWQESVRSGVVAEPKPAPTAVALTGSWAVGATASSAIAEGQFELNFRADPTLYDGRFANNGWLQELPKPLTLICWDNAVFVSPETKKKLGIETSFRWTGGEHGRAEVSVLELTIKDKGKELKVNAPVWVLPGHADHAVTVHLGSGRTRAGRTGNVPSELNADGLPVRGFNAYVLRTSDALWTAAGLTLAVSAKDPYFLACVQGQWSTLQKDKTHPETVMDRKPVRRTTVKEYLEDPAKSRIPPIGAEETKLINQQVPSGPDNIEPDHEKHHEEHGGHDSRLVPLVMYAPSKTLSPDAPAAQRHRWAMAIDLTTCTGCAACVVACVSENNAPVVGKYEVTRGRIMHWISIDRYYGGFQESPDADVTSFQPRMCVQCETAPCEIVCPVGATVHSVDGLNDMVYNRCVGTRYCSNNCPYKVRRFNFLTYSDWSTDTLKLGRNPEVSVRSRGVMEKCTFCVQRIRNAEIVAEREQRKIHDGEIMTACQSACPSASIMFGDLDDPKSVVTRWKEEPTNYGLLAELNTRPRLTHLGIVRNPNPALDLEPKGA